jgi:hypothetical protein
MLTHELWTEICEKHLVAYPRKVFLLLCAIKHLRFSDIWWKGFYENHRIYLNHFHKTRGHWYLRLSHRLGTHKQVLALVYSLRCSQCGCRFYHHIHRQYQKRLCIDCTQDFVISNRTLWMEYGLSLHNFIEFRFNIRHEGAFEYSCPKQLLSVTNNAGDLALQGKHHLIFFCKRDVDALFNLPKQKQLQIKRVAQINVIKAFCKRAFQQVLKRNFRTFVSRSMYNMAVSQTHQVSNLNLVVGWYRRFPVENHSLNNMTDARVAILHVKRLFRDLPPVELVASNEFTYRTMIQKFKFNADQLRQFKLFLMNQFHNKLTPFKIIKQNGDVYSVGD